LACGLVALVIVGGVLMVVVLLVLKNRVVMVFEGKFWSVEWGASWGEFWFGAKLLACGLALVIVGGILMVAMLLVLKIGAVVMFDGKFWSVKWRISWEEFWSGAKLLACGLVALVIVGDILKVAMLLVVKMGAVVIFDGNFWSDKWRISEENFDLELSGWLVDWLCWWLLVIY